ncbi:MAG TPA: PIN domain-containing protein [Tepidisphaeraceae bacterium]|jgi:predicted nucleic acid-binding protein|nr:PIN domain-containing protein [Tepidisphaeraceae bacterium]
MTVFLDTNILLDVLGERHPHYATAALLWGQVESGALKAMVSAISFNNIHYIIRKSAGSARAREAIVSLNAMFSIVPLDAAVIAEAINTALPDFEDAIQYVSALRMAVDYFVTRDSGHFPKQPLSVVSAGELLASLASQRGGKP